MNIFSETFRYPKSQAQISFHKVFIVGQKCMCVCVCMYVCVCVCVVSLAWSLFIKSKKQVRGELSSSESRATREEKKDKSRAREYLGKFQRRNSET